MLALIGYQPLSIIRWVPTSQGLGDFPRFLYYFLFVCFNPANLATSSIRVTSFTLRVIYISVLNQAYHTYFTSNTKRIQIQLSALSFQTPRYGEIFQLCSHVWPPLAPSIITLRNYNEDAKLKIGPSRGFKNRLGASLAPSFPRIKPSDFVDILTGESSIWSDIGERLKAFK